MQEDEEIDVIITEEPEDQAQPVVVPTSESSTLPVSILPTSEPKAVIKKKNRKTLHPSHAEAPVRQQYGRPMTRAEVARRAREEQDRPKQLSRDSAMEDI